MFDIWIQKARDRMFRRLEKELDKAEMTGKSDKVQRFLVKVMPGIVTSIGIFLGMLWIFGKIASKYSYNRVWLIFGIAIVMLLRGINQNLAELVKP